MLIACGFSTCSTPLARRLRLQTVVQRSAPEVPWSDIIGMRNRLIYAYFDIDVEIVWSTVRYNVPDLIRHLAQLFLR